MSIIEQAGNKNPFKVPDDYFEKLPAEIANRRKNSKPVKKGIISYIAQPSVAAAILLMIASSFFIKQYLKSPEKTESLLTEQVQIENDIDETIILTEAEADSTGSEISNAGKDSTDAESEIIVHYINYDDLLAEL